MRGDATKRWALAGALTLAAACGDDTTGVEGTDTEATTTGGTGSTTAVVDDSGSTDSGTSDPTNPMPSDTGLEPVCGDGTIDDDEDCDDSNTADGDGCSATCTVEDMFVCDGEPSVCVPDCGDGVIFGDEECDDGDMGNGDGCSSACTIEPGWSCGGEPSLCGTGCGDGTIAGAEGCDDGNAESGDGCSASCQLESGWSCEDEPSICTTECGDEAIIGPEECDDGEAIDGDGCSAQCLVETGWYCDGEPSSCETVCGDGIAAGTETCDAGGLASGDGCSPVCQVEFGWTCDAGAPSSCALTQALAGVALGGEGGCILTEAGDVGCFGNNSEGEVGVGVAGVQYFMPAHAFAGAVAVAAGDEHFCALTAAGDVWCWGDNVQQQIGPNALPGIDEPQAIEVGGMPPIVVLGAGFDHNCAIDGAGAVWCWGDNDNRQLGQGGALTADDPDPTEVALPGGLGATDLGLGADHTCAVLSDQTVACWGDDDAGQLGDGASGTDSGDATVVPGLTGIVAVEAGRDATCAIDELGQLWCWGENGDGEVGIGTNVDSPTPQLVALPTAVDAVTMGTDFTCALLTTDEVLCWGEGDDFQLGYGDLVDLTTPSTPVQGLPPGEIVDIEAGARSVCVITAASQRWCWGTSVSGHLGIATQHQLEPTAPLSFSGPVVQLALSPFELSGVTCAVLADGTVECAGDGTLVSASSTTGAVSLFGPITHHLSVPTPIPGLADVLEIGVGDSFMCARTSTQVLCWGDNSQLQLGQGDTSTTDIALPTPVVGLGAVDELEVGDQFACVRTGGTVQCWGDNDSLQTGEGSSTADESLPVTVAGIADAIDLELGENHACVLRSSGVVSCWGDDGSMQLGDDDGNASDSALPVDVTGLPGAVDAIAVGLDHACALSAAEVYCWGDAITGQLGQGNTNDSDTAVVVSGLPAGVVDVVAGEQYTCARTDLGELWCWGEGEWGNLGNGGPIVTGQDNALSPVPFGVATGITAVEAGTSHTCIDAGMGWQCVGFRSTGQLGDGTSLEPPFPMPSPMGL